MTLKAIDELRHITRLRATQSSIESSTRAILELADRLDKIESNFRAHFHHTLNQDAVGLPVLADEQPDPQPNRPSWEERIEKAKEKIKTACFLKQPREGLDEHIHTILTELMEAK